DRSLVTGAGTHLQNLHPVGNGELLGHEGDDIWLAYCLAALDRQRLVGIGLALEGAVDELFARDTFHCREHARIAYPTIAQVHDQLDLAKIVGHLFCLSRPEEDSRAVPAALPGAY